MAENKKGFMLYADQKEIFMQLPDNVAGKLIKLVFKYVNDENPKEEDLLLKIAFTPIKLQLKRDLKKWEGKKEERSESGNLGNLKRWNLDLYNDVINKKKTLFQALTIAKNRSAIKSIANVAVNDTVNVTVNDTVIVNDINTVKEKDYLEKFNNTCKELPKLLKITPTRKKSINARIKEYGAEKIYKVFTITAETPFLNGDNKSNWKADFDWIMKPNNFIKILEGNYKRVEKRNFSINR